MELVVKGYGVRLGYSRGAVVIRRRGEKPERVPLHEVERIWVVTSGVAISSRLIRACARNLIDIVVLDHRGDVVARIAPPDSTATVVHRRAQYEAYINGRGLELGLRIIYGKIMNQAAALRRLANARREHYRRLADAASELRNVAPRVLACRDAKCAIAVEGSAAQLYWRAISDATGYPTRDPDAADPFNAALNYGYALLRADVWRQVVAHGLDPYAGYIHADRSGRPSLVLDLMEEFRPHIDLLVIRLRPSQEWMDGGRLSNEARARLLDAYLRLDLKRIVARQVAEAIKHLEGRSPYAPHTL